MRQEGSAAPARPGAWVGWVGGPVVPSSSPFCLQAWPPPEVSRVRRGMLLMQVSSKPGVKLGMGFACGLTLQGRPSHSHSADVQTGVQHVALALRGEHRILLYIKV